MLLPYAPISAKMADYIGILLLNGWIVQMVRVAGTFSQRSWLQSKSARSLFNESNFYDGVHCHMLMDTVHQQSNSLAVPLILMSV